MKGGSAFSYKTQSMQILTAIQQSHFGMNLNASLWNK